MHDEGIQQAVRRALARELPFLEGGGTGMATTLVASAIEEVGTPILALNLTSKRLFRFNLTKAVTAVAGVLGASLPAATVGPTLAAAMAALASLGALHGLRESLPRACATVVVGLLPEKRARIGDLRSAFARDNNSTTNDEGAFQRSIDLLERLGVIRMEDEYVVLVETVFVRL